MNSKKTIFEKRCEILAPTLIKQFGKRKIDAYFCQTQEEAVEKAISLIPKSNTVSWGGSETLLDIGMIDAVKKSGLKFNDREETTSPAERFDSMRQALLCDTYISSVNAISEDGQIVNIDGVGNRVAAFSFGPKNVIAIVGMNKLCKSVDDAVTRARSTAAPLNAARVGSNTPCMRTGTCANCTVDDCICSFVQIIRNSRIPGRIKIILVAENLGY